MTRVFDIIHRSIRTTLIYNSLGLRHSRRGINKLKPSSSSLASLIQRFGGLSPIQRGFCVRLCRNKARTSPLRLRPSWPSSPRSFYRLSPPLHSSFPSRHPRKLPPRDNVLFTFAYGTFDPPSYYPPLLFSSLIPRSIRRDENRALLKNSPVD